MPEPCMPWIVVTWLQQKPLTINLFSVPSIGPKETQMNKFSVSLVFTLLICVSALAYGKSKPLADKQMDQISAGSAIADGESTATDSRNFEVELSGSSL